MVNQGYWLFSATLRFEKREMVVTALIIQKYLLLRATRELAKAKMAGKQTEVRWEITIYC